MKKEPVAKWRRLTENEDFPCGHMDYIEERFPENPWVSCTNRAIWCFAGRCPCRGGLMNVKRCQEHSPMPDPTLVITEQVEGP